MDKVQGWIKISLSIVITIGFFAVMFYLITTGKYEQAVNLLIGALIAGFTTIINYHYGSSKGSADKTALLAKQMKNEQP